ncbi:sialate O-acetylesterase [Chitinophaga sancti]|uniref:Sialate O-acetylesterase n=1 Tax=Chitinophaga sancti TaxID=1004 RepID=A0A1K1S3I6_9BACT|nr:sialate O-acetylesterase [Chitinophaga sancti]WQD63763.1 sialate O-acetylesterase [Chitinophaga sancti]WQG90612.1 sialate O-acetylesterase [Chitinophaga sancti]SFW78992.1 sialate O-acetylesterase [Chitinophaga sancti]
MFRSLIIPLAFVACFSNAYATLKPVSLFSDHMVLQKGVVVPVWGTAGEGALVTVQYNGQSVSAKTVQGKWMLSLQPLPYISKGSEMKIFSGPDTIHIQDVLVGEVWLCSGQSNMERQLGPRPPQQPIYNWEQERDAANYPLIREYYVPLKYSTTTIPDVNNQWTVCSPQTVSDFTAVGYFFAKNLYAKMQVPVGIIFSAFGGTPAEDWTSIAALESNPNLKDMIQNYAKTISGPGWKPQGQCISGLYNGMIYPLLPYAIKGVAWYQGESNNDRAAEYQEILPTMIANWRTDFKQPEMPFLIVQIAPHKGMRPEIREAQFLVVKKVKKTALIVTTDCGDSADIHPTHKQPVGERLAIAAAGLAYGVKGEYSGPMFQQSTQEKDQLIVTFSHTGKGLVAKGDTLTGFEISNGQEYYPAIARIQKNKIVLFNEHVPHPTLVRYGWTNVPKVNLYNKEGLPASPFRNDVSNN